MLRLQIIVLLTLSLGEPELVYGRFYLQDTEAIDFEARLSSEYYNDLLSYRYPRAWLQEWKRSNIGYISNYGSLDVRRFYYLEEIKFQDFTKDKFGFSFKQNRMEDTLERRLQQEIRLSFPLFQDHYFSILADGDTFKKFGDLGFSWSWGLPTDLNHPYWEVFYWSVDTYYNHKEEISTNRYSKRPYTLGMKIVHDFKAFRAELDYTYDAPMEWQRVSEGYLYTRSFKTFALTLEKDLGLSPWQIKAFLRREDKSEEKSWQFQKSSEEKIDLAADRQAEKSLKRKLLETELFLIQVKDTPGKTRSFSFWKINRDADYQQKWGTALVEEDMEEKPSADSRRREWALLYTDIIPLNGDHDFILGFQYNRLKLNDENDLDKTEVKLQTAWDGSLSEHVHMLINFTWDLDEIQRTANTQIRPWGGGNVQFKATF